MDDSSESPDNFREPP